MEYRPSHDKLAKGLTLVETLIAISTMMVVFTAMMPLFGSIRRSWDTRQAGTEILQNGRVLADHLHRELATAIAVTDVSVASDPTGYIEFVDDDGLSRRYEIGSDGYVRFGSLGSLADLAGPVSQFRFTCYDGNDFSMPTGEPACVRFVRNETTYTNVSSAGPDKTFTTDVYIRTGDIAEITGDEADVESHVALRDSIYLTGLDSVIDSYRTSAGAYNLARAGSEAVVSVNQTDAHAISLWSSASIKGDAYVGPGGDRDFSITVSSGSEITGVTGTLTAEVDISSIAAPTGLVAYASSASSGGEGKGQGKGGTRGSSSNSIKLSGSSSVTVTSDCEIYEINIQDSAELIVRGHVALVVSNSFEMHENAKLAILSDSSLTLYVKQTFDVSGAARLNDLTKDPSKLRVYMTGNNKDFTMEDNAIVHAVLQNPDGDVEIYDNAEFFGKLKADSLYSAGGIHVDLDSTFDPGGY